MLFIFNCSLDLIKLHDIEMILVRGVKVYNIQLLEFCLYTVGVRTYDMKVKP